MKSINPRPDPLYALTSSKGSTTISDTYAATTQDLMNATQSLVDASGSILTDFFSKLTGIVNDTNAAIADGVNSFIGTMIGVRNWWGDLFASWQPQFRAPFDQSKRVVCPIILDLDGNGVSVRPPDQGVYFDQNGDGYAERSAWTGAADGLLVRDRNGDGKITTGNELFGPYFRDKQPLAKEITTGKVGSFAHPVWGGRNLIESIKPWQRLPAQHIT